MYVYDEIDQRLVDERVAQFRDQTRRFLAGQLPRTIFAACACATGSISRRHAPMLRVSVPYGLLSSRQVRMLAHLARKYDKGFGHFTTRQNIQYNWPKLEQCRTSSRSGQRADAFDPDQRQLHPQRDGRPFRRRRARRARRPRPWCEIIRQWSTLHPEFSYLPRKFKIAITGSPGRPRGVEGARHRPAPRAMPRANRLRGPGGRRPRPHADHRPSHPRLPAARDLLAYLDAILRVYNQHGRRDNIHKARIKMLVKAVGPAKFREMVEAEFAEVRDIAPATHRCRDRAREVVLPCRRSTSRWPTSTWCGPAGNEFQAWYQRNTRKPHKVAGYRAVVVSLKSHGERARRHHRRGDGEGGGPCRPVLVRPRALDA
jgi:sulfite reductase (NADPH) hemoprotein beta-component